jgi:flavodoxin
VSIEDSMKINIYYFSGTGNTAWVVRQLAERLTELGDVAQGFSCEEIDPREGPLLSCDVLGIAFPVHGSWAPGNFRESLAKLPPVAELPLFAVACAGYAGGDAAWYAARPLIARGYVPFLYANVFMPNNLLFPVPKSEQVRRIVEKAKQKVERLAPLIHEHRRPDVRRDGWLRGVLFLSAADSFASDVSLAMVGIGIDRGGHCHSFRIPALPGDTGCRGRDDATQERTHPVILGYFGLLEIRVMCSHCPHYAEAGFFEQNPGIAQAWGVTTGE